MIREGPTEGDERWCAPSDAHATRRARDAGASCRRVEDAAQREEQRLREALGIPTDARTVLLLGETSHWDPNWLFTAEEYYERRIAPILEEVFAELEHDPRRIFSIEALFFLQKYWERHPERRDLVRRLVRERRLRFTGTGITTPDTLLPATEAILRDYLYGQGWLRREGLEAEPRLAYLPDDFGHSPALPSILAALGFRHVCITRIDGMYFAGTDYRLPRSYPLPGSSADLLMNKLRTQDFVWRAEDGAEVLCHWNAFTYFQGDMLAHVGIIRWMGVTFGVPWRTGRHIARRIDGLVRKLAPLARTPYLFCPIGCDFNGPIPRLLELVDRYNETHYASSGVWVVNAGMDDYFELVEAHREKLPVLELDPNPYWMGFYASRPDAKRLINRAARKLVLAEKLAVHEGKSAEVASELERGWEHVVVSNHHDFITGTSPERVYRAEQLPWLLDAEAHADACLARLVPEEEVAEPAPRPPAWRLESGRLRVETPSYRLVFDQRVGGCIVSAEVEGRELLSGPGNDLVMYRDSGGLWRLGHEFAGGTFRELGRASDRPARIEAREHAGLLEVRIRCELGRREIERRLWFRADRPIIRMEIEGSAARQRTVTCRFPTRSGASSLVMNVPGGVVERPMHKLYAPTFWPARSFVHVRSEREGWGLAAFVNGPACVALTSEGVLEWVALRNAPIELAYGILPVPAHPASGSTHEAHRLDYAVWLTPRGDWRDNHLARHVRQALRAALFPVGARDLDAIANAAFTTDHPDVLVTAIKPASRGEGVIARLRSYAGARLEIVLRAARGPIRRASLCDARERDLEELTIDHRGGARVPVERSITSVRLEF